MAFAGTRRQLLHGAAASFALSCGGLQADEATLDLLLVLAVDASGSVDRERFHLQKQGYVDAFRDEKVLAAIKSGPRQSIAVTMFQWTGPDAQAEVCPWMVIKDRASCFEVAAAIEEVPRRIHGGGTSISGAIDYAVPLFARSSQKAPRMVIDISGDGSNNGGRRVTIARDDALGRGVTINGLPILAIEPNLDDHYREEVIGGPGSFLVAAKDFSMFSEAILKKLITEIAVSPHSRG
jgi:hypothetical protein